jgi:cellulose biosynthesis protein BcsQ
MSRISPAKRLAIFNHKGGVGKTTLTVNIAAAVSSLGFRVLIVDSDPQCNVTAYLIEESVVDSLLDSSDSEEGQTIWSAVKPVVEGKGSIKRVTPFQLGDSLQLIAGDVRLIEFEQDLGNFWGECFMRRVRGFNGITALSNLVDQTCADNDIDYVFFDSGPNIGALNRVLILDCDYIIVPVACDLFSLRAIKTLGHTLASWIRDWNTIAAIAPEDVDILSGRPRFLGYIPQRFRVYRGQPSREYANVFPQIERRIQTDVVALLQQIDPSLVPFPLSELKLGEVKDFGSLAAASQLQGTPISEIYASTEHQRSMARETFDAIASNIVARTI